MKFLFKLPVFYSGAISSRSYGVESESVSNSRISPGRQFSSLQRAQSVENLIALALPVFKIDKFASVMPMRAANSLSRIFRLSITSSSLIIIFTIRSYYQILFGLNITRLLHNRRNNMKKQTNKNNKDIVA